VILVDRVSGQKQLAESCGRELATFRSQSNEHLERGVPDARIEVAGSCCFFNFNKGPDVGISQQPVVLDQCASCGREGT
jgi:hypothetical protein